MRLLLLAAFPGELREALAVMGGRARIHGLAFRAFCVRHPSHTLTVAETGLGIENAARVFLRVLQAGTFDAVISLGYCGALSRDASVGDLVWASKIGLIEGQRVETLTLPDDRRLLETLSSRLPIRAGTFLTLKGWMKKQDVRRFVAPDMTLPVCEMETFALARLALHHKLPFFAVRAVSDGPDLDIAFDPRAGLRQRRDLPAHPGAQTFSYPAAPFGSCAAAPPELEDCLTQPGPRSGRLTSGTVTARCPFLEISPARAARPPGNPRGAQRLPHRARPHGASSS